MVGEVGVGGGGEEGDGIVGGGQPLGQLGEVTIDPVGEELAVLRAEVASLRAEMAELRRKSAGVPAAE